MNIYEKDVSVLIGAGLIGKAIARRVAYGELSPDLQTEIKKHLIYITLQKCDFLI